MNIILNKSAQGPVLAKGIFAVTKSTDCGVVGNGVGCQTELPSGNIVRGTTDGTTTTASLYGKTCC